MKKLLISIGVLISLFAKAQVPNFVERSGPAVTAQDYRLAAKFNFYLPHNRGFNPGNGFGLNGGVDTLGAMLYDDSTKHIWYRDTATGGGHKWSMLLTIGDGGTVISITMGLGLLPGTITTTGTINVDTSFLAALFPRRKDSTLSFVTPTQMNSQGFLKTIAGISAGGVLSGPYPNPGFGSNVVQFANVQQISAFSFIGNPTAGTATPQSSYFGYGLRWNNDTIKVDTSTLKAIFGSASGSFITGAGNLSPLFTTGVSGNNITFSLSNAPAGSILGNNTGSTGPPAYFIPGVGNITTWLGYTAQPALTSRGIGYRIFDPLTNGIKSLTCTGCTLDSSVSGQIGITVSGGGGGGTNLNVGSGYRWAIPGTNNIKTFFCVGCTLDSTTNSNALTITVSGGGGITQLTGDGTAGPGSGSQVFTLATVNSNVGTFGSASSVSQVTLNAKGLVTAASSVAIQISESQVTNLTTDLAGKQAALSGTGYVKFAATTPSYLTPTQVTADLNVFTSSLQGLTPSSGGGTTNFLRADGTWAAPPGGGGSGTVTTFSAGALSPLFTTSVATATTTPALTFSLSNAAGNSIFGNSTGTTGAPSFFVPNATNLATWNGAAIQSAITLPPGYVLTGNSSSQPVAGANWPQEEQWGVIYQKTSWPNLYNFTVQGGLSIGLSGNFINFTPTAAGTFTNYATIGLPTTIGNMVMTAIFQVPTITSTSYGGGVGLRSANQAAGTGSEYDALARMDMSTSATRGKMLVSTSLGGTLATSATAVSITAGDLVQETFVYNDSSVTVTAVDITTSSSPVSVTYTFVSGSSASTYAPNTCYYAIYSFSAIQLQALTITSNLIKNPTIVIDGDSKTKGYFCTNWSDRLSYLLNANYATTDIYAGGYDRVREHLTYALNDDIRINGRYVIMNIGSNSIRAGESLASVEAQYDSLVQYHLSTGAIVLHMVLPEDSTHGGVGLTNFKNYVAAKYAATYIDVWDSLTTYSAGSSNNILQTQYDAALNGVHPNSLGNAKEYQTIIASALISACPTALRTGQQKNTSRNFVASRDSSYLDPVFLSYIDSLAAHTNGGITGLTANQVIKATSSTTIGNSLITDNGTSVGVGFTSPAYPLDINAAGLKTGLHISSSGAAGGGYFIPTGTGLYFAANVNFNGTQWLPIATSATILAPNTYDAGGMAFYGNTGLTAGTSYTPSLLMNLFHTGNLVIGGGNSMTDNTNRLQVAGAIWNNGNLITIALPSKSTLLGTDSVDIVDVSGEHWKVPASAIGGSSYTFTNGLTNSSGTVSLGGTLIGTTSLVGTGQTFTYTAGGTGVFKWSGFSQDTTNTVGVDVVGNDSSRRMIPWAKFALKLADYLPTYNIFAANGLTAAGGDSIYLGGTLNQNTTIDGGGVNFTLTLGNGLGNYLGAFGVNSNNIAFNIAGGGNFSIASGGIKPSMILASNANLTLGSGTNAMEIELPTITANRTITLESPTGNTKLYDLYVTNQAGFAWSFATTVKDLNGNTVTAIPNGSRVTILADGTNWYVLNQFAASGNGIKYQHTIFTPTTGTTVNLVNNQYNIVNPSGALAALTVALPSSPQNNDVVYIKYTQTVSVVTYSGGTVVSGITAPTSGTLVVLTYDAGTTSWY